MAQPVLIVEVAPEGLPRFAAERRFFEKLASFDVGFATQHGADDDRELYALVAHGHAVIGVLELLAGLGLDVRGCKVARP